MITDDQVITIENAKHVGEYKLELVFNDGTRQEVNFYPFLTSSPY